jgi:carboxyl-terminal processing protease
MLSSLDPHSQFMDEEAYAEIQKDTRGEFNGLGIVVGVRDNTVTILSPQEDSPSFKAGILPGDRILKIDGKSTDRLTLNAIIKRLRGNKGDPVTLTILRPNTTDANQVGQVLEFSLVRDTIKVPSIKDARILSGEVAGEDKIAYIRIELFADNTNDELEAALAKMEPQGLQGLILDLRNNPGGLIDSAVSVAGQFLPPKTVVVTTQGRDPESRREYASKITRERSRYPLIVLVNSYSASAAEIVSGALKDLRRAIILGENTFGKGSVQTVQPLGGGLGLRLTTAKYYTPSKQTIHQVGIAPDIDAPISEAEERALAQLRSKEYLTEAERKVVRNQRDTQLERAVAIIKGIRLYAQRQPATLSPVKG